MYSIIVIRCTSLTKDKKRILEDSFVSVIDGMTSSYKSGLSEKCVTVKINVYNRTGTRVDIPLSC